MADVKPNTRRLHGELMQRLQLQGISFKEASFRREADLPPKGTQIELSTSTDYDRVAMGFDARLGLDTAFFILDGDEKRDSGKIRCVLVLRYRFSEKPDPEGLSEFIDSFVKNNVLFNAWPFLREWIHEALNRMGWPPHDLPLLKRRIVRERYSESE